MEIYLLWGKALFTQHSQKFPSEGADLCETWLCLFTAV